MTHPFSIIVAVDSQFGIGKNGTLPWRLPGELKYFKAITTRSTESGTPNLVIMGRKTWESLPEKYKPLPDRTNCVLTRNGQLTLPAAVLRAASLEEVLQKADQNFKGSHVFVIGGAQIFTEAINHPGCDRVYLTQIQKNFNCDTFFPSKLENFKKISESPQQIENDTAYSFLEFQKKA